MSVTKDFNYSGISVVSMRFFCFLEGLEQGCFRLYWLLAWHISWDPKGKIHLAANRKFLFNKKITKMD